MLGKKFAKRIDTIVTDVITETLANGLEQIAISDTVYREILRLRDFLYTRVYFRPERTFEKEQIEEILLSIHAHVRKNPDTYVNPYPAEDPLEQRIIDFIAGMTDRYAINLFKKFIFPEYLA